MPDNKITSLPLKIDLFLLIKESLTISNLVYKIFFLQFDAQLNPYLVFFFCCLK